jgi:AhpC/TSA family
MLMDDAGLKEVFRGDLASVEIAGGAVLEDRGVVTHRRREQAGGPVALFLFAVHILSKTRRRSMFHRIAGMLLLTALSLASVAAYGQEKKKEAEPPKIKLGDMAPDFTLLEYDGQGVKPVSLHDFRGKKKVALAFFVFAFTGG